VSRLTRLHFQRDLLLPFAQQEQLVSVRRGVNQELRAYIPTDARVQHARIAAAVVVAVGWKATAELLRHRGLCLIARHVE